MTTPSAHDEGTPCQDAEDTAASPSIESAFGRVGSLLTRSYATSRQVSAVFRSLPGSSASCWASSTWGGGLATGMIGVILAAGVGRWLRPYTDALPKALVPVDGEITILDIALRNFAAVGLTDVTVVVGYAAEAVEARQAVLEDRHGVEITLVHNDKAEEWNNAYSLWLARKCLTTGALLVNGDTVHPVSVEKTLLAHRGAGILLAVDNVKSSPTRR